MFSRFRKTNYWEDVGGLEGFHQALEKLGSNWKQLDKIEMGYTNVNSIWGQLADLTELKNKDTYDARKWLYTAWNTNRHKVRTTFLAKISSSQLPIGGIETYDNAKSQDKISNSISKSKTVELLPSVSSDGSVKSNVSDMGRTRSKQIQRPTRVQHFTVNNDEWRRFYDAKTAKVADNWTNQLATYIKRAGITCSVVFKKRHEKKKESRKKNCNVFSCKGRCTIGLCPVELSVIVGEEPKNKISPTVFTVYVFGHVNHDRTIATAGRPLRGLERTIMAQQVHKEGPLAVYEYNLRHADENLLQNGNLTQCPPTDVLKTAVYEFNKKYRLDEDMFKEVRIFRELTYRWDEISKEIKGLYWAMYKKTGEWPFEVHFFSEPQVNSFIHYCEKTTYSYLHIDATGSVVRKLTNQKQIYFYAMVYTDQNIASILPASGALLADHTTGSITAYFNNFRGKIALLNQKARPSFVVIDFSPAILNSVLASFNTDTIHVYLRRCYNTLDGAYSTSQLKQATFVRLCCSHVMKAFARSLHKLERSREARRKIMSVFVILLNTNNVGGAYDLYQHIMNIYADPYNENSSEQLVSLLSTDHLIHDDVEKHLDEKLDDNVEPHFLDEVDVTKDAIIHQSPFNVKACAQIPTIKQIIRKEKLAKQATNQLYAPKIVQLFHKWFAYLPLWSCIMVNFIDRYANDGMNSSSDNWSFGHGRVSNASVESYFRIVKESVLQKKTRLRPCTFLMEMYFHTQSRFKAEKYEITQYSSSRKSKQDNKHFLNEEDKWSRRGRSRSLSVNSRRSFYMSDSVSETKAFKISSKKTIMNNKQLDQAPSHVEPLPLVSNTKPNVNDGNQSSSDDETSSDDSFQYSNKSSGQKTDQSGTFLVSDAVPLAFSLSTTDLPMLNEEFPEVDPPKLILPMTSSDTDTTDVSDGVRRSSRKHKPNTKYTVDYISPTISPTASRLVSPKRSHSLSTATPSPVLKTSTAVQKSRKKGKQSPLNSPDWRQVMTKKRGGFTNIGTLQLAWPRYGIRNAIYEGKIYSVTKTCPLDTGLFILYYAYKAGTPEFRDLFERDTLEIYATIRRTFQLIESDDWTIACLYWLTKHNLLDDNSESGVHDIENTLTEIVFKFIQTMQEHPVRSKCSCDACPRRIRSTTNCEISLIKTNGYYQTVLPAFTENHIVSCNENLGPKLPRNYPAKYWVDDRFPVYNIHTKTQTTETRYMCQAERTIYTAQFAHPSPPFLILNVGKTASLMWELPEQLSAGQYQYNLIAGTNNTAHHFTAIIKTNNNQYVRYNDLHPQGCFPLDGMIYADFAIYALNI